MMNPHATMLVRASLKWGLRPNAGVWFLAEIPYFSRALSGPRNAGPVP
jgi:hypothetical protein